MRGFLAIIGLIAIFGYWQHSDRIGEDARTLLQLGAQVYAQIEQVAK